MRELALNLMDLIQNSITAKATAIRIELAEDVGTGLLRLTVSDNGRGMDPRDAERALSPFFSTRDPRGIGLGLPLLKAEAERTGGSAAVRSRRGKGTEVTALFHLDHIDMVPLGDLEGTVELVRRCNPGIEIALIKRKGKSSMKSLEELRAAKERTKGSLALRENAESGNRVLVGMATCGIAAGAKDVLKAFVEEAGRRGLTDVVITQTGCMGLCQYEPTVEVSTPGGEKVIYGNMTPEKAVRVLEEHVINGRVVTEYTVGGR